MFSIMMEELKVREANPSDQLAVIKIMEKSCGAKETNMYKFEHYVFGENVFCLLGEKTVNDQDILVGFLLYYYTYSTWKGRCLLMEDIYVSPSDRRTGVASVLLKKVLKIGLTMNCKRLNFQISQDNIPGSSFSFKYGARNLTLEENWHLFRMEQTAMNNMANSCNTLPECCKIRKAKLGDGSAIMKLILELADYEKMPEGPQISYQILEADGFGNKSFYECYIAEKENTIVGYVLFFLTYNYEGKCLYMEDLYVTPSHRGKGIGSSLWRIAIQYGLDNQCLRSEFSVLSWNTPSISFYNSKRAEDITKKEGIHFFRLNHNEMKMICSQEISQE
ncbi:unnamed protein product [Meganyctiphanes norvegica]|uniref:N-acetyltransferase domain-containing protein n=1 Tax=Meganyctiphanes norvegica TaxID=48144 RepID=A0AAV2QYG1_MEGNR